MHNLRLTFVHYMHMLSNMINALQSYMEREKVSDTAFSEMIGRDRSVVSRLRRGKMLPSLEVAAVIENVTSGKVPMSSWVPTKAGAVSSRLGGGLSA